jgi:RimJ/RimL family protein N-acetyltransferase
MPLNALGQPVGESVGTWRVPDVPPHTPVEGRYARLEPLSPDAHAEALFDAISRDRDGRSWTYMPYGPFESLRAYRAWMDSVAGGSDPLFFAIIRRGDERPAGVASYLRIAPANGSIEVGHIHYSPLLQQTAAATEAMFLMMQRAFELGYRRYEWKCDALNTHSRRAAERLGLSFEGVFRQATVYKGRNRDTAWYAAIDREWPALQAAFNRWLAPDNFIADGHQRERLSDLTAPILQQRD